MKHTILNLMLLVNSIFLILYMGLAINMDTAFHATGTVPLFLSSLMLIDVTYISSCNIRENKVVSLMLQELIYVTSMSIKEDKNKGTVPVA